jgi:hypothetical protein
MGARPPAGGAVGEALTALAHGIEAEDGRIETRAERHDRGADQTALRSTAGQVRDDRR